MKIRFRTDVEQGGEQSRRQHCPVNSTSAWSPRGPVSSGTPPTQNPADKSLRRGAACCARLSAVDRRHSIDDPKDFLRRGAGACALSASRVSSRGCARRGASDRCHPLANSRSIPVVASWLRFQPQPASPRTSPATEKPRETARYSGISNRNWPTNRSYRKQTIKPCLIGTRIAHFASRMVQRDARCDSSELSIPVGLPLRRNR
jgi:hypothetical protein